MSTLYLEADQIARALAPVLPRLMQRDPELGRRLRRGADELVAHAEESMLVSGRGRRLELRAAAAALRELAGCVRAAKSIGYLDPQPLHLEARIEALAKRLLDAELKRAQAGYA